MRSLFEIGLSNTRNPWMGQATIRAPYGVYAFWDSMSDVFESGGKAYETYGKIEVAESGAEGKEAEAAAKEAAARTAAIQQQTTLLQQQAIARQNQIMGIDKTAFFIGAGLLGLVAIGGTFMMLKK